jgi:hypothetical protein
MKAIPLVVALTICLAAVPLSARQTGGGPISEKTPSAQNTAVPNAEDHLRMLSEKLGLTAQQQEKLRPILQNMFEERQKVIEDKSLSTEQRHERQQAIHEKADREARKLLNEDQKRKLDELEAQHRAESSAHMPIR